MSEELEVETLRKTVAELRAEITTLHHISTAQQLEIMRLYNVADEKDIKLIRMFKEVHDLRMAMNELHKIMSGDSGEPTKRVKVAEVKPTKSAVLRVVPSKMNVIV